MALLKFTFAVNKLKTMELTEFIEIYNCKKSIILLEGKRNVLESDKEKLIQLGSLLASCLPLATLEAEMLMVPIFTFQKVFCKLLLIDCK